MENYDVYKVLKSDVYIITLDDNPIVLPNGKCGWKAYRFAKSALSNLIGTDESNKALASGKFKIIKVYG